MLEYKNKNQRLGRRRKKKKQKPADLHRFAYNILAYSDATETDIKEIESGIWKQKHKVIYLVPTLEFNNTRTYDCNKFNARFYDNIFVEYQKIIYNEEFEKLQNLLIFDDAFKNMKNTFD